MKAIINQLKKVWNDPALYISLHTPANKSRAELFLSCRKSKFGRFIFALTLVAKYKKTLKRK